MRWADLDLDDATWTVPAEVSKNGRANVVPLSPAAMAIITDLPKHDGYVLRLDGEDHWQSYGFAKRQIDGAIDTQGEPLPAWRFHDLRRTVATHLGRLGVAEAVIGRVLNHAAVGVTARVYNLFAYLPEKRSALDRWAAELDREVAGKADSKVVSLRP
jgi:integrase